MQAPNPNDPLARKGGPLWEVLMTLQLPDIDSLPPSALLTRKQVAALTGFHPGTLKAWARDGRGPRLVRPGGAPRYRVGDLRDWIGGRDV